MLVEMDARAEDRYARLKGQGGSRLPEPREAAKTIAADDAAAVRLAMFRALGDPTRFLIAELLRRHGPLASTELEIATGVASSTMSHHLRVLETARLVVPENAGDWTFWRLAAYPLVEALVPK